MISVSRVLDYVVEILKASPRPLVAREICSELRHKGVTIEKTDLNQILWKQNTQSGLLVDKQTFRWRYGSYAAEEAEKAEKRKQEIRKQLAQQTAFLKFWENIGFEFVGVRRERTDKPLFFLKEDGDWYWVVGPTGNLLREKANRCSSPEPMVASEFTIEQIQKAAEEVLKEHHRKFVEESHHIIRTLRETETLADEVYIGPTAIRVDDVIPVSAVIFVGNVSGLEPSTLSLGWGTVLAPFYLVINVLGMGVSSDTRYGVFKVCVYELLKQDLVKELDEGLILTLYLENDRVYIGTEKHTLYLD
jgi:hypothetical protein